MIDSGVDVSIQSIKEWQPHGQVVNSNLLVLGAMCFKEIKQSTTKLHCLGSEGIMTVL